MSLHGQTKGTKLEKLSAMMANAEAHGVMMYHALARLAREQGLEDVAAEFIDAGSRSACSAFRRDRGFAQHSCPKHPLIQRAGRPPQPSGLR